MNLKGRYTSRDDPKNSKTYGEGTSLICFTVFELYPKNCHFFLFNKKWAKFTVISQKFKNGNSYQTNFFPIGLRILEHL